MSIVVSQFRALVLSRFGSAAAFELVGAERAGVQALDVRELHEQVERVAAALRHSVRDLWRVLGVRLFAHGRDFSHADARPDGLEELAAFEGWIRSEVRSLYSDTQASGLQIARTDPDTLVITYTARRQMGDLLEGLIRGCVARLRERIYVRREEVECERGSGVRFIATRAVALRVAA